MTENWTTISDGTVEQTQETKIVFEEYGDEFIGDFLGFRELTDRESGSKYTQARFRAEDGEICYVRANHSMKEGLNRVTIGTKTKVTYVDDVDTGMPSPMRSFTVQTAAGSAVREGAPGGRSVRRAANPTAKVSKPKDNAAS